MTRPRARKPTPGKPGAGKPTPGKPAAGKRPRGKPSERNPFYARLPRLAWLFIALAIIGTVVFIRIYPATRPPSDHWPPRAAIVDQLYNLQPNLPFIAEVTGELEDYGFQVSLHQGDEIDVDFYRELPTHGYSLLVLRVHSGLLGAGEQAYPPTLLFTNEEYSRHSHRAEQVFDRLAMGRPGPGQPGVFGITPTFVTGSMGGTFDDTVVILMGCGGIYLEDMAEAFIQKGASAYVAWDHSVLLSYVDDATPYLIRELCSQQATMKQVVDRTMSAFGPDPDHGARLQYYPPGIGDKTLAELAHIEFPREDDTTDSPEDND